MGPYKAPERLSIGCKGFGDLPSARCLQRRHADLPDFTAQEVPDFGSPYSHLSVYKTNGWRFRYGTLGTFVGLNPTPAA